MEKNFDFIGACRSFIGTESSPGQGNGELAILAADLCRELGLHVEIQDEQLNGIVQVNVIARPQKGTPPEEFMLQNHLDTIDPGNYGLWTRTANNPFQATIYDGKIYGLGTADAKLDYLCKLRALLHHMNSKFSMPPVLVGTFGEELGMWGAIKLIRKKKVRVKQALIGEPSDMNIVHAGKGLATVEISVPFSEEEKRYHRAHDIGEVTSTQSKMFNGKAAHSSDPSAGDNAIDKMLEYLTQLPEGIAVMVLEGGISANTIPELAVLEIDSVGGLRDTIGKKIQRIVDAIKEIETEFEKYPDPAFFPQISTLNLGMIRTYEDGIVMRGICRIPPKVSDEVYYGWMDHLNEAAISVGGGFKVLDFKPPFQTDINCSLIKACQAQLSAMGLPSECSTQSVTNEANIFSRFGIECVAWGPGLKEVAHTPNEHVDLAHLEKATEFYKGLIQAVCK